MSDTSPLQAGQKVGGGRFTVVRPLGRGGMGEVWLAQDERLQEPVALKFLPPEIRTDPAALDDLRHETARSHRLTHTHIVRIHDFQEPENEAAFISMEYVDGPTLTARRVEQPGRVLAWDFLHPVLQQLCAALDYAHGEHVIHRDLKPSNLMLDSRRRLKLADFGIAAVVSDSISRVSQQPTSGTLAYMSPQQLAGKRPQVTDDLYALGATLYELLTSKPPFFTGDITHQVLNEAPEPLDVRLEALGIRNAIPGDVAALVMACLAKEPGQRPQSARAVAEWIGLDMRSQPALQTLTSEVFSRPKNEARENEGETEPAAGATSKLAWACLITFLVLALASGWYWKGRHRTDVVRKPPPVASPAQDESGFVNLLNGHDFAGWRVNTNLWSLQDGALDVHLNDATDQPRFTMLMWTDRVRDFELRLRCRFLAPARINEGTLLIYFRHAFVGGDSNHLARTYFTSINANPANCGAIHGFATGAARPNPILVRPGQKRTLRAGEPRKDAPLDDPADIPAAVKGAFKQDWNDVVIQAIGPHILVKINGVTTAELFDEDAANRPEGGGIMLSARREQAALLRAQFKDIRLKWLGAK